MESSKPSTSTESLPPSHRDANPKEQSAKRTAESTQGMTSDSPSETRPLKKMKVSHHTDKMLPLTEDKINDVFKKIFADGKIHGLSPSNISATKQPLWFKSRWVWKAISIFDNAVREASKRQKEAVTLNQLLQKTITKDPYLNLVVKRSILQALALPEELSGLDTKSKATIKLWLRYTFATEGFDVNNEWLDEWLYEQASTIACNPSLFYKFVETENLHPYKKDIDTQAMTSIGLKEKDLTIDEKPKILEEIIEEIRPTLGEGAVADYIPALAEVDPCQFGIAISTMDGEDFAAGDAFKPFSIQSISKVFNLALAMRLCDDDLWSRVGVEPSGNAFNSLSQLEYEHGIPRNPFINAGALVITDSIISRSSEPVDVILEFARSCAGNPEITYNEEVFRSELAHGHRNRALINYLCSFDNIANDTEQILTTYFYQCSLAMTCMDLA
ncbi:glutaminase, partial [Elysia marginata]